MSRIPVDKKLRRVLVVSIWIILAFFVYSTSTDASESEKLTRTGVVRTKKGKVRGMIQNGVKKYLGIPYAKPPLRDLRWKPPQKPKKWTGVRDAVKFGSACPQKGIPGIYKASTSEDCLYLSVYTPKKNDNKGRNLPVMVWIYGGRLVIGQANPYKPQALVSQGNVIVVTFNYRIGSLGFFSLPSLNNQGNKTVNYGLMDQQAALEWVKHNISSFGGDPDNVTIFGQSAGGMSVLANMASPSSKNLFQRAIVESPSLRLHLRLDQPGLKTAEDRSISLAKAVGCEDLKASCLRHVPVSKLLKAQKNYITSFVVDGKILPLSLRQAFRSNKFNHVPVIIGNAKDEWRFQIGVHHELKSKKVLTAKDYESKIKKAFKNNSKKVLKRYPLIRYNSPSTALAAVTSDALMICPTAQLASTLSKTVPVYVYGFSDRTSPKPFLPPVSFPYGASHLSELPYIFVGFPKHTTELNALQKQLSDEMISYWTSFADNAKPKSRAAPEWNRYKKQNGFVQVFRLRKPIAKSKTKYSAEHNCEFWDSRKMYKVWDKNNGLPLW